jgi:hypothetical protein
VRQIDAALDLDERERNTMAGPKFWGWAEPATATRARPTLGRDDRKRYVIKYISYVGDPFRGSSGKFDHYPVATKVVRGTALMRRECQLIRQAGGRVRQIRSGWFA